MTSPTLAQLSDGAERLFWRLTVVADDYGRFEADVDVIRSACFPKMLARFSVARVDRLVRELSAARLITLYRVRDREYGAFVTWANHQRVRAEKSKFPDPSCGHPLSSADTRGHPQANAPVVGNRNRESRVESRESDQTAFDRFWAAYPRKVGKVAAEKAWTKLAPSPDLAAVILTAIERQRTWPQWTKESGQFIPHPATWLNGKRWEDEHGPAQHAPGDLRADRAAALRAVETPLVV